MVEFSKTRSTARNSIMSLIATVRIVIPKRSQKGTILRKRKENMGQILYQLIAQMKEESVLSTTATKKKNYPATTMDVHKKIQRNLS